MPDIIAGRQPVLEALKAGQPIEKVFVQRGALGGPIAGIFRLAKQRGIPIVQADKDRIRELAAGAAAQGVVALAGSHAYVEVDDILRIAGAKAEPAFVLMLDEIEDPHNLGALIRTAECAGVHGVIIPKHHAATLTAAAVKSSAGATAHMAVARVTNLVDALNDLKERGLWVIGTDAGGDKLYDAADYTGPVVVVVGNEGRGLRKLVKESCDFLVRIPLHGKVESLNASVSGALVMFEGARQRSRTRP